MNSYTLSPWCPKVVKTLDGSKGNNYQQPATHHQRGTNDKMDFWANPRFPCYVPIQVGVRVTELKMRDPERRGTPNAIICSPKTTPGGYRTQMESVLHNFGASCLLFAGRRGAQAHPTGTNIWITQLKYDELPPESGFETQPIRPRSAQAQNGQKTARVNW